MQMQGRGQLHAQNMPTSCPACNRKYEVPLRPQLRADDWEFSPTPRLLPCLHSCCQSCLIDLQQRSAGDAAAVVCPTCNESQQLPKMGPLGLPYDSLCMQVVLKRDRSMYIEHCHRCQDEVPVSSLKSREPAHEAKIIELTNECCNDDAVGSVVPSVSVGVVQLSRKRPQAQLEHKRA
jgi:hypothetical protein